MHLQPPPRAHPLRPFGVTAAWTLVLAALPLSATAQPAEPPSAPSAAPAVAPPMDETPAKAAYRQGREFFKVRKFADAIREFNKANRLDPNPVLVFNMARAFEELQQYGSAIEYYRKYLEMEPHAADRKTVEESIRTLEILKDQQAAPVLVPLTVTSQPDGARVLLDGREIGVTPLKTTAPVGHHFLVLEHGAYERASAEIDLTADAPVTRDVVLVARPVGPGPAEEPGISTRTWSYIALATGGALLVGGGIAGYLAKKKADKLDQIDADPSLADAAEYDDLKSAGKTSALVADGLFVGGALGAGIGLFLLLTSGGDAAPPPSSEGTAAGWAW